MKLLDALQLLLVFAAGLIPLICTAIASKLSNGNKRATYYFGYLLGFAISIFFLWLIEFGNVELHKFVYLATFSLSHIVIVFRFAIRKMNKNK